MNKLVNTTALTAGAQVLIPLDRLKKSPDNVRKSPHSSASLEAYAASIAAKGILQNLVVAPEIDEAGQETGFYCVTVGEGRRLAQLMRVDRGEIDLSEPMPCVVRLTDDAMEVSLDENVTREDMHPADQFEAFRALNEQRGMSAEDIAARFGVTAKTVKQRLRLGAVSPRLMQEYRDGKLNLDQLMAFCLTEDHARQEAVYEGLNDWQRDPYDIRRLLTKTAVRANDRRAVFVGAETYIKGGGQIERDLFTEDGDGYFTDSVLLDQIAVQRLTAVAVGVQNAEGWKWAEGHLSFPYVEGMKRAFPKTVDLSAEDGQALEKAQAELLALSEEYADYDYSDLPEEIDIKMTALEAQIARLEALTSAYDPDDIARGGIIVSLTHDGTAKIERGLIRFEDLAPDLEEDGDEDGEGGDTTSEGGDGGEFRDDQDKGRGDDDDNEPDRPLSDGLVRDLTTHRTVALRLTLGDHPELATRALTHALVLGLFYRAADNTCLEIRPLNTSVREWADDYSLSPAVEALDARHLAWAAQLPEAASLWDYIMAMEAETLGLLLAHCVGLTVNVVRQPHITRLNVVRAGNDLASRLELDMTAYWRPTARSYFSRVSKGHIVDAVREAVGEDAADRIAPLKKLPMAETAEQLVATTGWLPPLLRTPLPAPVAPEQAKDAEPSPEAAE